MRTQYELFSTEQAPPLPSGLKLQPHLLSNARQAALVEEVRSLPFRAVEFKGYLGKRRTASFGWKYDFGREELSRAEDIPAFLLELRDAAAGFAELPPEELQQILVTEYSAGSGIGWHKDKAVFGEVVGISLLSPCTFRLRRRKGQGWERASFTAEPGSAYLLRGPSRNEWEHSIPPVESLRYSVTFRNVRARPVV
jgi:alkylated DNA repair dioxygenase AlkB